MSYILDALRKSETERRQGRVPDLGQQVQLIHKPKKKSSMVLVWVGIGLVLNAAVLAYVFWPSAPVSEPVPQTVESPGGSSLPASEPESASESEPESETVVDESQKTAESKPAVPDSAQPANSPDVTSRADQQEKPTIIVPSQRRSQPESGYAQSSSAGSVPHLVELPLAFQKSVPDLVFNSHIYASEPSSRRVMINNQYLRAGDSFSGIRVDQITEQGVVLSKDGRQFRVGSVRDWVSPD